MRTTGTILTVLILQLLAFYGYTYSCTAGTFAIQGYIGAAIPPILGALLFAYGHLAGTRKVQS